MVLNLQKSFKIFNKNINEVLFIQMFGCLSADSQVDVCLCLDSLVNCVEICTQREYIFEILYSDVCLVLFIKISRM